MESKNTPCGIELYRSPEYIEWCGIGQETFGNSSVFVKEIFPSLKVQLNAEYPPEPQNLMTLSLTLRVMIFSNIPALFGILPEG